MCSYCKEHNPEKFKKATLEEQLVTLADQLDSKGLTEEASIVDGLLVEAKKKKEKKEKEEKDDDKDDKKKGKKKMFPFWLGKKKKAELLTSLSTIANTLDTKGLTNEANEVDQLMTDIAAEPAVESVEVPVA